MTAITSGAVSLDKPFAIYVSGKIILGKLSTSGAFIVCSSGAIHFAEIKE